jgi:hypothetical protein
MTRSELVLKIQKSFIENTNKLGYINMSTEIASNILSDIELLISIEYTKQIETNNESN